MTIIVAAFIVVILLLAPFLKPLISRGEPMIVVAPLVLLYGISSISLADLDSSPVQYALLALALGALILGRLVAGPSLLASPRLDFAFDRKRLLLVFFAGVAASMLLLNSYGIPVLSADLQQARIEIFENGYLATVAVAGLQSTLIVGALYAIFAKGSLRAGLALLAVSTITLGLFGNRGLVVFPLIGVVVLLILSRPKFIPLIGAVTAALAFLVSFAGYSRDISAWGISYLQSLDLLGYSSQTAILAPIFSYLIGTSQAVDLLITTVPSQIAHPAGSVFFNAFLSPLPGEQPTAGEFLKSAAGLDFTGFGLAMGGVGGFYLDFGVIGVFVGYFLFGLLLGVARRKATFDSRWTLVMAYTAGHVVLMNFAHPIPNLAFVLIPILLIWISKPQEVAHTTLPKTVTPHNGEK